MGDYIQVDTREAETLSEEAKMLNEGRCRLLRVKREMPQCGRKRVVL